MGQSIDFANGPIAADPAVAVHRTIVFTDIVGSTALLNEIGDARWLQVVIAHHRHAQQLASELGADHVAGTGDGVFVVFADEANALRFAADMDTLMRASALDGRCIPVQLHVGVATGPVLKWQEDYYGRTVHLAARLSSAASGGEVVVSCECAQGLADGGDSLGPCVEANLRGFARPHRVHRLPLDSPQISMRELVV